MQGDFGLSFEGPYHVDGLLRVPLICQPAPGAGVAPAVVAAPVGLVDLAPTFCEIAGIRPPAWMEGAPLPTLADAQRPPVLTTFDSQFAAVGMHLRTIFDGRYLCTAYEPSHHRGGAFPLYWAVWRAVESVFRIEPARARRGERVPLSSCYSPVRLRWLHPGQQQGRRLPSSSSSCVRRMRRSRVFACFASMTQQMNSLRASGVMSFQASRATTLPEKAARRSSGSACTTPPAIRWRLMRAR